MIRYNHSLVDDQISSFIISVPNTHGCLISFHNLQIHHHFKPRCQSLCTFTFYFRLILSPYTHPQLTSIASTAAGTFVSHPLISISKTCFYWYCDLWHCDFWHWSRLFFSFWTPALHFWICLSQLAVCLMNLEQSTLLCRHWSEIS